MGYRRVIPRDLFNEAKLLKCLGQLALIVHEGRGVRWTLRVEHEDPEVGFRIDQAEEDGSLCCRNVWLYVREDPVMVWCAYNSKQNYPLLFEAPWGIGRVLDEDGRLSDEFKDYLDQKESEEGR